MSQTALAELSNLAVYSATVVYALALLAHIFEWAAAREPAAEALLVERVAVPVGAPAAAGGTADGAAHAAPEATGSEPEQPPRADVLARVGLSLTVLAFVMHLAGVASRGIAAERVPWGNMYEFAITAGLAVSAAYLAMVRRYGLAWLGLLVTGFVTTVLGLAVVTLYVPVGPLVPALNSYWLVIHVSAAILASGAFTVGALSAVLYLVRARTSGGRLSRLPSAEVIDRVSYRIHAFAFPIWTFALVAGAIWAEHAWGRYWGWDPKEVFMLITWLVYASYLHARATAGWRGRKAATIALVGYGTFLFNFVGINLIGSGLHAYAGL